MFKTIFKLFFLLNLKQRYTLNIIIFLSIIAALAEMISVILIVPLSTYILKGEQNSSAIEILTKYLSINGTIPTNTQIISLTAFFAILSIALKSINVVLTQFYVLRLEADLGRTLLSRVLTQSYAKMAKVGSANYIKLLTTEISQLIYQGYFPLINFFTNIFIVIFITTLLIISSWEVASILLFIFMTFYMLIFTITSSKLSRIGGERVLANKLRFKTITNLFSSLKYVKVDAKEDVFEKQFYGHAKEFSKLQSISQIIALLPRYLMELLLFSALFIFLFYFSITEKDLNQINVGLVIMYVYGAYRIMPAAQVVYASASQLRFAGAILANVRNEFVNHQYESYPNTKIKEFNSKIEFKEVCFEHSNRKILKNLNCEIFKGEVIGISGRSGAGKTTFIDILCGLQSISGGSVFIDGVNITNEKSLASELVSYVPQETLLLDGTIKENIEFFRPEDSDLMAEVLITSEVKSIIESNNIDQEYYVGEKGINLSGGQAQRIGIARAIYKNSEIMIFDEATSALDKITEKRIINNLVQRNGDKTVFIISHNIDNLRMCDKIYFFNNGSLSVGKSVAKLYETENEFRKLVEADDT
jgi:ATP-binding cassette, subfamily B, bacterial PglK